MAAAKATKPTLVPTLNRMARLAQTMQRTQAAWTDFMDVAIANSEQAAGLIESTTAFLRADAEVTDEAPVN